MFRKDQKYCREGLRLMTVLAKQFSAERNEDGEDLKEAWELALLLLKAFWYVANLFPRCSTLP